MENENNDSEPSETSVGISRYMENNNANAPIFIQSDQFRAHENGSHDHLMLLAAAAVNSSPSDDSCKSNNLTENLIMSNSESQHFSIHDPPLIRLSPTSPNTLFRQSRLSEDLHGLANNVHSTAFSPTSVDWLGSDLYVKSDNSGSDHLARPSFKRHSMSDNDISSGRYRNLISVENEHSSHHRFPSSRHHQLPNQKQLKRKRGSVNGGSGTGTKDFITATIPNLSELVPTVALTDDSESVAEQESIVSPLVSAGLPVPPSRGRREAQSAKRSRVLAPASPAITSPIEPRLLYRPRIAHTNWLQRTRLQMTRSPTDHIEVHSDSSEPEVTMVENLSSIDVPEVPTEAFSTPSLSPRSTGSSHMSSLIRTLLPRLRSSFSPPPPPLSATTTTAQRLHTAFSSQTNQMRPVYLPRSQRYQPTVGVSGISSSTVTSSTVGSPLYYQQRLQQQQHEQAITDSLRRRHSSNLSVFSSSSNPLQFTPIARSNNSPFSSYHHHHQQQQHQQQPPPHHPASLNPSFSESNLESPLNSFLRVFGLEEVRQRQLAESHSDFDLTSSGFDLRDLTPILRVAPGERSHLLNMGSMESVIQLALHLETSWRGISPEELARLPTTLYRQHRQASSESTATAVADGAESEPLLVLQDRCMVCLEDFEDPDELRGLSCSHVYHVVCVDKWLKINRTCPMCRADAILGPSHYA